MFARKRIFLDTETTGLYAETSEILTLSMVDQDGNVLWDKLYKPQHVTEWPEAQKVNGISPDDVVGRPSIEEDVAEIVKVLRSAAEICIYNARFDLEFLEAVGIKPSVGQEVTDVMLLWADAMNFGKWEKLTKAADAIGYDWGVNPAHSSVGDCLATRAVFEHLSQLGAAGY